MEKKQIQIPEDIQEFLIDIYYSNTDPYENGYLGGSKVDADGVYTSSMADAEIVRATASRAKQIVLVAEKYKFTNHSTSPYMSIPLDKVDVLITDTPLSDEIKQHFNSRTQIIPVLKE